MFILGSIIDIILLILGIVQIFGGFLWGAGLFGYGLILSVPIAIIYNITITPLSIVILPSCLLGASAECSFIMQLCNNLSSIITPFC